MAYDIVVGRSQSDIEKYGTKGTILIAKNYVKMGQVTSLSNKIYMDVTTSHVLFICGKRGGGKSYTMGVIAEGMVDLPEDISQNLSIIMLDTMGIYWTMKYPNHKDEELLGDWGLKGKGLDVKIYTPSGYFDEYKKKGVPTDAPFSIMASELDSRDWLMTFGLTTDDPIGVLIERTVYELKEKKSEFYLEDLVEAVRADKRSDQKVRDSAENHFITSSHWGLFAKKGEKATEILSLAEGGNVTVLDVSCYATMPGGGWAVKAIVIGLVAQKLFIQRMIARKDEEYKQISSTEHYFSEAEKPGEKAQKMPLVWLVIDEAHEFMPHEGKTMATDALVTILREGRQPGISLILATQQPGKIHTDVMTQSDIVLSHRLTARIDVDALSTLMQSYMRAGLDKQLDNLPRVKGSALLIDDMNERMYPIRIRPRFTWHGGASPSIQPQEKKVFEF